MPRADRFKPYAPDVRAVVRLEEALPADHPVHVFVDPVRAVDLDHFVVPPGPKGEKPYHPPALFGVLAWGYLHGVRSSRKLARLARQEATFVYLAGGGAPDHRTLARFRRDNAAAFVAVFQETVVLALRLGLARLGHVALDGTKLRANTSKHQALSYGRMRQREAQLREEITRLAEQAEAQDAQEDQEYGADSDGHSVAEELALREARLAKIRALRERPEAEERAEQGLAADQAPAIAAQGQRSFADGDARMMLLKRGEYAYAYNAQAAVDAADGVLVAADQTNVAPDEEHLPGLVQQLRRVRAVAGLPDETPTTVSADAGYFSHANAAGAGFSNEAFGYDAAADVWVCPTGQPLARQVTPSGAPGRPVKNRYHADPAACAACPLRLRCLPAGAEHRVLVVHRGRGAGALRLKFRQPDARRR